MQTIFKQGSHPYFEMDNYLGVLLLSVLVLLGAFYFSNIKQRIVEMKQELYGYDIKKVTEEFGSTTKALTQVKKE